MSRETNKEIICPIIVIDDDREIKEPFINSSMMIPYNSAIIANHAGLDIYKMTKNINTDNLFLGYSYNYRIIRDYSINNLADIVHYNFLSWVNEIGSISAYFGNNSNIDTILSAFAGNSNINIFDIISKFTMYGAPVEKVREKRDKEIIDDDEFIKDYKPAKIIELNREESKQLTMLDYSLNSSCIISYINTEIFERYIHNIIDSIIKLGVCTKVANNIFKYVYNEDMPENINIDKIYILISSFYREKAEKYIYNILNGLAEISVNIFNMHKSLDISADLYKSTAEDIKYFNDHNYFGFKSIEGSDNNE